LKDGERSSLPQYLHIKVSALDVACDDCFGRRATFLVVSVFK
jgi:hypothetical protein